MEYIGGFGYPEMFYNVLQVQQNITGFVLYCFSTCIRIQMLLQACSEPCFKMLFQEKEYHFLPIIQG